MKFKYTLLALISVALTILSTNTSIAGTGGPNVDLIKDCTHNDVVWRTSTLAMPCPLTHEQITAGDMFEITFHHDFGRLIRPTISSFTMGPALIFQKLVHNDEDCILGQQGQ